MIFLAGLKVMMNFQVISLIERDAYSLLRRLIMWKFVSSACMCKNTVMTALNLIQSKSAVTSLKWSVAFLCVQLNWRYSGQTLMHTVWLSSACYWRNITNEEYNFNMFQGGSPGLSSKFLWTSFWTRELAILLSINSSLY